MERKEKVKLISIIIPAFNAEKYIIRNLQSIYQQKEEYIEVIVINDGSNDGTKEIVSQYIEEHKDLEIKLINISNGGLANARNIGIKNATGKYFINLDSDDFLKLGIIKLLYEKINSIEFDVCMYGFEDYNEISGNLENPYEDKFKYIEKSISGSEAICQKLNRIIWICQGNACYKKAIVEEYNIYNVPGINQGEDLSFITRFLVCSKKVIAIPKIGVSISYRQDSMMHSAFNESHLQVFLAIETAMDFVDSISEDFLKNKKIVLQYLEREYEIHRLAIAKKIIANRPKKELKRTVYLIKNRLPKQKEISYKLLNKTKKIESFLLNNNLYLYCILVCLFRSLNNDKKK